MMLHATKRALPWLAIVLCLASAFSSVLRAAGPDEDASEPPEIPFGYDAFLEWGRWA